MNDSEISWYSNWVLNSFALHGSCTTTGILTFTLWYAGEDADALLAPTVSTWMVIIPTSNVLLHSLELLPMYASQTIKSWILSHLYNPKVEEVTYTDQFSQIRRVRPIFWHELGNTALAISYSISRDYRRFVDGNGPMNLSPIVEEPEENSESFL